MANILYCYRLGKSVPLLTDEEFDSVQVHMQDRKSGIMKYIREHGCSIDEARAHAPEGQRALDAYERVDILINNAGIGRFGTVVDFTSSDWDAVINSNLKAVYLCTKSVLSPMLAQGSGQIINVLSIAAKVPFEASSAYCAAKAGALAFTKVLASEVRQQNIRVTAVLPGSVHTPFWDEIPQHPDFEQMLKPDHVADTVVSVCQQPSGMVTEEIVVMPPLGIL